MISSGEAGIYVPSLAARSVLSQLPSYAMQPLASLRGSTVGGLPVLGLVAVVVALIVAEHLRRRRGK